MPSVKSKLAADLPIEDYAASVSPRPREQVLAGRCRSRVGSPIEHCKAMTGSRPRLETSIRGHLGPMLKSDGFSGSGRTFRRVSGDFIHVVQVQGSRYGGRFAINLGIQPICIPDCMAEVPNPKTIREEICAFRRRLSESKGDQWWDHDATKESMDLAVQRSAKVYATVGRRLFSEQSGPEAPLHRVTPEQFQAGFNFSGFASTGARMARALAMMRQFAGNLHDARAFARIALASLGPAHGLCQELQLLLVDPPF